ncbi:hypothetical protein BV898_19785, partial [Hypsibius exemplaris]
PALSGSGLRGSHKGVEKNSLGSRQYCERGSLCSFGANDTCPKLPRKLLCVSAAVVLVGSSEYSTSEDFKVGVIFGRRCGRVRPSYFLGSEACREGRRAAFVINDLEMRSRPGGWRYGKGE